MTEERLKRDTRELSYVRTRQRLAGGAGWRPGDLGVQIPLAGKGIPILQGAVKGDLRHVE